MAGIGFHIERLLSSDTFTGSLKAYLHAGMISSGNMLATYACLLGLVTFSRVYLGELDLVKFQVTVTSVYCLSMLLVGPLQMVLHRYLADVFYEQCPEKVLPCLRAALAFHSAAAIPLGLAFFSACGFEGLELVAATLLLGLIVWIWICSTFLGACKAYETITAVFFVSLVAAFGLSHALGQLYGFAGLLSGFALGHLLLFVLLYMQLVREFPSRHSVRFGWLAYSRRFQMLVLASTLSNVGIWADKLVFWASDGAVVVQGLLRYHPVYDPCMFCALLTSVPDYARFLLALETHFFRL
ncbi:MAG: exopolysaccharide Pel transporter PelG, partial [Candidatus Riflebacteria bacterium]|nr:exopolysaccharide Pel transporter PelG [Candidatus Riflebacteria bacterium]